MGNEQSLDEYIDAFDRLFERFDRRMADVAAEITAIESELDKLSAILLPAIQAERIGA